MSTVMAPPEVKQRIVNVLDRLPVESLTVVDQFVHFLENQAQQGRPVVAGAEALEKRRFRYPTVPVSALSLDRWLDLVPEGYEGDALADTESLFDEV